MTVMEKSFVEQRKLTSVDLCQLLVLSLRVITLPSLSTAVVRNLQHGKAGLMDRIAVCVVWKELSSLKLNVKCSFGQTPNGNSDLKVPH